MVSVHARPRHWALLASAASLVVLALSGTWVVATATSLAVHPAADAYVESSSPNTNFGSGTTLRIDGSPTVRTYIRFDLRSQAGTVSSARLQLYANTANNSGYEVVTTSDGWTQSGLTFADAPAISSAVVGSTGGFAAGTTTSVDVTNAVHAGAVVDFAIVDRNATAVSFGGGTSVHPPVLNVSLAPISSSSASVSVAPTPQPSATAVPSPRPAASSAISGGDPVLVGAGDICVTSIIGNAAATAKLIEARPTDTVFTLGDNSNESGTASQYTSCYAKTWGTFLNRTHATIGNHDCMTAGCAPYYAYFGAAAGPAGKGYYSYNLANNWHVIVLNTQGTQIGGTGVGSPEETWLRADLAANAGKHIIAMWHIPVFTSGLLSRSAYLIWWQDLYAAHADLILDGHDHLYERFAPQSPAGIDDPNGIREFIVGTGGAPPQPLGTTAANSQVRNTGTFGVLVLTLHAHSYSWEFVPVAGSTFTDSGIQTTHN